MTIRNIYAGAVEKDFFNSREHKAVAKHAKLKQCSTILCDLSDKPLLTLRLMDFDFLENPKMKAFVSALF